MLCWIIAILSAIGILITVMQKTGKDKPCELTPRKFGYFLLLLLPIALSMPLMKILGFVPGSIVIIAALQFLCGERRWIRIVLVSVLTAGITYAGLWYGLKLPLPS